MGIARLSHSDNKFGRKLMKLHKIIWAAIFVIFPVLTHQAIAKSHNELPDNTTFDGLVEVKKSSFQRAWVDPTIDFTRYTKVMPGDTLFEFRAVRERSSASARSSSATEFYISEEGRQRLIETVTEVFDEELAKSEHFEMVREPGPDVLILDGAMLDIVSRVPPQRAGRSEVYISRVGEITLVLQLRDSMSGETLARAAERRALEPPGRMGTQSNPVSTWQEVRRVARRWGTKLRKGLDEFHEEKK
jgi:hypothetical protein